MRGLFVILFMLIGGSAVAQRQQKDSLHSRQPLVKNQVKDTAYHSPRKATLRSMMLPGLGQAYNKKYWKIPVIYAGAAALIYGIRWNNQNFKEFNTLFRYMTDGDSSTTPVYQGYVLNSGYTSWIVSNRNYYRKNRDFCSIGLGALYVLNIIDANVDAHLFEFNISDDLSLRLEPRVISLPNITCNGIGAVLKF